MRRGFDLFSELTADPVFSGAAWLLESYGRVGVRKVSVDENAVSPEERHLHILTSPMLWWKGDSSKNRDKAVRYGQRMQKAIRTRCNVPHTYVNYAMGAESLSEVYGKDTARVNRLVELKKRWDPKNRFGFYNPLARN